MNFRILMLGGDSEAMIPDAEYLRNRGFRVYTCANELADEMISEIVPDVVFVNPNNPGLSSTKLYHELLDNVKFSSIPLIYTLAEDEVYLVNTKRTAPKSKRNFTADNIIDGIRLAITKPKKNKAKTKVPSLIEMQLPYYAHTA
ncbi:MAG: hypothetical protein R2800_05770 [Flavipsychrobacter sp.]